MTAEVFAVAWRRRMEWPPDDERRLWLYGVARNVLKSHERSNQRQHRLANRMIAFGEANPVGPEQSPPDDTIWLALTRLDQADRELLIMRAWDRLAIPDMAKLLDCSENATSIRLTRARSRLRAELDALRADEGETTTKDRGGAGHEAVTPMREEPNR